MYYGKKKSKGSGVNGALIVGIVLGIAFIVFCHFRKEGQSPAAYRGKRAAVSSKFQTKRQAATRIRHRS